MVMVVATWAVVAAFYLRIAVHARRWLRAALAAADAPGSPPAAGPREVAGAIADVLLLRRLFLANPALWFGEWLFHAALTLVVLRHLRYVTEPVPAWVGWAQTPGWMAGFVLPAAVLFVLAYRALARRRQYTARANYLLLADVLLLAASGLALATGHRVDLVQVKAWALGTVLLRPVPPPADPLLAAHVALALALLLYVPSHVFAAPLTMLDARRRERALPGVLHDA